MLKDTGNHRNCHVLLFNDVLEISGIPHLHSDGPFILFSGSNDIASSTAQTTKILSEFHNGKRADNDEFCIPARPSRVL